jgi:hypothetical protein
MAIRFPTSVAGLPMGDWCAATNSPATPECHDALRAIAYQVLQGFDVTDATCDFAGSF